MPTNPDTGKADRHAMSVAQIREFRINQVEASRAEAKRGKRRARESPDADEPEGSQLAPSPLASLYGLKKLSLEGGKPSPTATPTDSPATFPRPPLPENPAPAPPSLAPKARKRSKPSPSKSSSKFSSAAPTQHSTGPTTELPSASVASQLLEPVRRQASHSPANASPASDDQTTNNAARISLLEAKQLTLENMMQDFDRRLRKMGG